MSGKTLTVEMPQVITDPTKIRENLPRDVKLVVYGTHPCDWAGGRRYTYREGGLLVALESQHVYGESAPMDTVVSDIGIQLERMLDDLAPSGTPFYAAMTNVLPHPSDDREGVFGFLDSLAEREGGGVIVAHPVIHEAIKNRYGKSLTYVSSVIRYALEPDVSLGRLFEEFDWVVLRPETVKDDPESIRPEWREKAVVMVNYTCVRDCPKFLNHQQFISAANKKEDHPLKDSVEKNDCPGYSTELLLAPEHIQALMDMGFMVFKLGRFEMMDDYCRFAFPFLSEIVRKKNSLAALPV